MLLSGELAVPPCFLSCPETHKVPWASWGSPKHLHVSPASLSPGWGLGHSQALIVINVVSQNTARNWPQPLVVHANSTPWQCHCRHTWWDGVFLSLTTVRTLQLTPNFLNKCLRQIMLLSLESQLAPLPDGLWYLLMGSTLLVAIGGVLTWPWIDRTDWSHWYRSFASLPQQHAYFLVLQTTWPTYLSCLR